MPSPDEAVYWIDQQGNQIGPEPFETLCLRVHHGQVPETTAVWWRTAPEWLRFADIPSPNPAPPEPAPDAFVAAPAPDADTFGFAPPAGEPVATEPEPAPEPTPEPAPEPEPQPAPEPQSQPEPEPEPVSRQLLQGFADQELDDEFIALVARSWELYKETEHATSIDEVFLGAVITAMVDSGFLLIDVETAGATVVAVTPAADAPASATGTNQHRLRFETPADRSRVTIAIEHLTPDAATAKLIGHRAAAIIGYGERVPNFSQVGQAVRQELASAFIASPEPGTVGFDADMTSGYVYAQIDLLLELDRYVREDLSIDHELLRKHLASVVYTMQSFVRARFAA